jgi:ATP-dependent Lon protease
MKELDRLSKKPPGVQKVGDSYIPGLDFDLPWNVETNEYLDLKNAQRFWMQYHY